MKSDVSFYDVTILTNEHDEFVVQKIQIRSKIVSKQGSSIAANFSTNLKYNNRFNREINSCKFNFSQNLFFITIV